MMRRKLNILFVNSIQMFAGGEVWMLATIGELRRRKHHITLLCRPETELSKRARQYDIELVTLKIRGDFDPVTIYQLYRLLKKKRIDIILTNMEKELRLCGMAAKLVGTLPVISRRGIDHPLKNKLHYRFTYNCLTTCIVANSESTKRSLLQNSPWLNPNRIQVIYNGIDPDNYSESKTKDLRGELDIPKDSSVVGFVGQLNERKGLDTLLPAFKQLREKIPQAMLLAVGKGDMQESIEHFVSENKMNDSVRLIGFREDIPNVMRTIDMLVLPSWWEGFGIVLIEAMAAGKPVITTNVSSMPEIVTHGETGLIVALKNVQELYEAMYQLILYPQIATTLGRQGREDVERRFTLHAMVDQYESLFYRLIQ